MTHENPSRFLRSWFLFLSARANEQIYNNATEGTKIIYISLYAGAIPAGAGKSHQSLRDISLGSIILLKCQPAFS